MNKEYNNKTVVITGASRGIGAACAEVFADAGANTVLLARSDDQIQDLAQSIKQRGGKALAIKCDMTSWNDVEKAVAKTIEAHKQIDFLINNAGVINPIAHVADSDPELWSDAFDINLKGVYHGIRAVLPPMIEQQQGVIINISSGAASHALDGWSHYCSSKAAVLSLTKCVQQEYKDKGIRVTGFSPGTVATDMQVSIKASGINPVSKLDPAVHIPASDAAQAIAWLCSEDAADIAGEDFSIKTAEDRVRAGLSAHR